MDFLIPGSTSLKDKRQVMRAMLGPMRSRFNVSVAEVDHQDLRQRGAIAASCVCGTSFQAKKVLHELEKFVRGRPSIEVLNVVVEVVRPDG